MNTIDIFLDKLRSFDYYYGYSDDHRVWLRGCAQAEEIKNLREKLNEENNGLGDHVWEKYLEYVDSGFNPDVFPIYKPLPSEE